MTAAVGVVCTAGFAWAGDVTVNGRTFHVPEGFTVELVAGPPVVERPISADFDEAGNLYVSDSSGFSGKGEEQLAQKPHRIVKLTDTKGTGTFDGQTVFADHMMFPEGTMWYHGSLYVAGVPSLWKLTDVNGDGVADQRSEWFAGRTLTGCANDLHGPYAGPDGRIYWCKGAFAEQTYVVGPGKKPFVTRAAHLFRARADGSEVEPVMTGGMDNPVEIAFSRGGERFFTTTFLVNPANGQRDGIIHAIYGGIYGKVNAVTDDHVHTSAELMPVMVHLGPAAACGLMRYEGEALGAAYRDNLFATSFNLRKVTRHVLTPDGATFKASTEDFMVCDSFEFHPTHVLEDADGSLLVVDTGGWYKICCPTSQLGRPDVRGAIYRVRRVGAANVEDPRGLKLAWDAMGPAELAKLLDDARPVVRRRAVDVLGMRGTKAIEALAAVVANGASAEGRLNAVWASSRIADVKARAVARAALADQDETVRQAALHVVALWRDKEAVGKLAEIVSAGTPHNRRAAAEGLGRIGDAGAVAALLNALASPVDRVLEHSIVYAMIEIGDAASVAEGLARPEAAVRRGAMVALDQLGAAQLTVAVVVPNLTAADPAMRATAGWIAGRHAEWGEAVTGAMIERMRQPNVSEADRAALQHQLAAMSKGAAIQRLLAERAADAKASAAERRLALGAMAEPSGREAPAAWVEALVAGLAADDADVVSDAVSAAHAMRFAKEAVESIRAKLVATGGRDDLPAAVRLRAMASAPGGVGAISSAAFEFVMAQLSTDHPLDQRLAAAEVIGTAKLNVEQQRRAIEAAKTAGAMELDRLLSAFDKSSDEAVGHALVAALREAKAVKTLRADALRRHTAKFPPAVKGEVDALLATLTPDAGKQKARLDQLAALIPSGDAHRGQAVFNNAKTACVACHAVGYVGGHVGPDLTHVGSVRTERDLLESVVFPSASFVQTFEPMTVITDAGERHDGIVRRNDAEEVWLVEGPDKEVHLPRRQVKEMRPGTVSVMPEGFDGILTPAELADLVAFLKACR